MVEHTDDIRSHVQAFLQAHPAKRYVLAVSGGVDSMVLMHALKTVCTQPMLVVHVNHGLSPFAADWQAFVTKSAADLQLECLTQTVSVVSAREGIEAAARRARYDALQSVLQAGDVLLTGHHSGDQAETLLFRLCRGTGLQGLAGMSVNRPLGDPVKANSLGRPLLGVTRGQITAYANREGLSFVEDDSNADSRFSRNYLRSQVIPLLDKHWPGVSDKMAQAAGHLQEAQVLLDEYAEILMADLDPKNESLGRSLKLDQLLSMTGPQQALVLRYWLAQVGVDAPSAAHFSELLDCMRAQEDQQPEWCLETVVCRRFRGRLYCLPTQALAKLDQWSRSPVNGVVNPRQAWRAGPAVIGLKACLSGGLDTQKTYSLLPRAQLVDQGVEERSKPKGRQHSQTLKRLLQEYNVPPWLRASLPVLVCDGQIAAVSDLWVDERFWQDSTGYQVAVKYDAG